MKIYTGNDAHLIDEFEQQEEKIDKTLRDIDDLRELLKQSIEKAISIRIRLLKMYQEEVQDE